MYRYNLQGETKQNEIYSLEEKHDQIQSTRLKVSEKCKPDATGGRVYYIPFPNVIIVIIETAYQRAVTQKCPSRDVLRHNNSFRINAAGFPDWAHREL